MAQTPLLSEEINGLTETERMTLTALTTHPGFAILEKLLMTACKRTNDAVIQLDPTDETYDKKIKPLQQKARERNEFAMLILNSIEWHKQVTEQKEQSKPEVSQNRILAKAQVKTNV